MAFTTLKINTSLYLLVLNPIKLLHKPGVFTETIAMLYPAFKWDILVLFGLVIISVELSLVDIIKRECSNHEAKSIVISYFLNPSLTLIR